MAIDFDPNAKPKKSGERLWATYREWRSPKFKIHNSKGQAKQALGYTSSGIAVYYRDSLESDWVKVGELPSWYSYDRTTPGWSFERDKAERELKDKMDAIA